jgi:integrase
LRLLKVTQGWIWWATDLATRQPIWVRPEELVAEQEDVSQISKPKIDDHLERFCEIGFYSGTRKAAILNLGWTPAYHHGWIDFSVCTLYRSGPKQPKTRKRQTPCRIHDRLLPRLIEWREKDRAAGIDWVIHFRGERIKYMGIAFKRACRLAGLDRREIDGTSRVKVNGPGLPSPHILRHTRATLMLRAGLSIEETAQYLGMSARMVETVYGHHHVEYQRRAAAV